MQLPAPPLTKAPVLVGFSGGLDSSVLLHMLAADAAQRQHGLRALHVHHGLQLQADAWAGHCHRVCDALGIELQVRRVQVRRVHELGIEAAAREARHAAFAQTLAAGEVLALGHHQDDQAETFLLRALRGSGTRGLGAMRPERPFAGGWLWRPLLRFPRQQLLDYAQQHGLAWLDDPSNLDPAMDRNFLRNQVLPLLGQRWPQAAASLARSAELAAQAEQLLEQDDALALAEARSLDPSVLRIDPLRRLAPQRCSRVLRRWIEELQLPPLPASGVEAVQAMLQQRDDALPCFDYSGARIQRWRGLLRASLIRAALPNGFSQSWDGRNPLPLPDGSLLRLAGVDGFEQALRVHARQGGERIRLPGRGHRHSLKQVLQMLEVPPWERACLPLLSNADGRLLAAADLAFDHDFDAWLRRHGARLYWIRPGTDPAANTPSASTHAATDDDAV